MAVDIKNSNGIATLKRPDGASLIPWKRGRSVAWDVTVADTFAASYIASTSVVAGTAAARASSLKVAKIRGVISQPYFCAFGV